LLEEMNGVLHFICHQFTEVMKLCEDETRIRNGEVGQLVMD